MFALELVVHGFQLGDATVRREDNNDNNNNNDDNNNNNSRYINIHCR